jgi:ferritin-like metal-binding protein YciE
MNQQTSQVPMQSPTELFVHELSEIYGAEQIILGMLQDTQKIVLDAELKIAIEHHMRETREQIDRIERVFEMLGARPYSIVSRPAEGLRQSLEEALSANPSDMVRDGLIAGDASKTEYFEVASYNLLVQMARAMVRGDIATILQGNLEQENMMRQKVDTIFYELAHRMTGAPLPEHLSSETAAGA